MYDCVLHDEVTFESSKISRFPLAMSKVQLPSQEKPLRSST
jgi:hypothetical protein